MTRSANPPKLALTGPTGQPSDGPKPLSFLLSSASWKTDYFFVWIFPPWDLEKLQYTRVNILDLKILQVFFKNRGEILGFEKMLNFLSFWFYFMFQDISSKKNFKFFFIRLINFFDPSPMHLVFSVLENFTSVFQKQGGILVLKKIVEFLEFSGFTLHFRTFQAKNFFFKNFHQTDRKILPHHQFTLFIFHTLTFYLIHDW